MSFPLSAEELERWKRFRSAIALNEHTPDVPPVLEWFDRLLIERDKLAASEKLARQLRADDLVTLARMHKERDTLATAKDALSDVLAETETRREALAAEVERLRGYTQHRYPCHSIDDDGGRGEFGRRSYPADSRCTCGLDKEGR